MHTPEPQREHFTVRKRADLSLGALLDLQANGDSVLRTPHVGNQHLAHLLWHKAGGRSLLYDRTLGRKDTNFHPHGMLKDRRFTPIADADILMTHARVDRVPAALAEHATEGEHVHAVHERALKRLVPEVRAERYGAFLARKDRIMLRLLEAATEARPAVWERSVDGDGRTRPSPVHAASRLHTESILDVTNAERGRLVPNILNVLLVSAIEALEHGRDRVYHVSGPDMIRYIDGMRDDLDFLYGRIRARLADLQLPAHLEFHLVPLADLRFAVHTDAKDALDELIDLWKREQRMNAHMADLQLEARTTGEERPAKDPRLKAHIAEKEGLRSRMGGAARACADMLFDTPSRDYLAHHDFTSADELYIHPWAYEASAEEAGRAVRAFRGQLAHALRPSHTARR